jgi:hypothetical protein
VPEIAVVIQSFLKAGFLGAVQVELLFMIGCLHPVTKAARFKSFRNLFRNVVGPAIVGETRGSFVERDHGPLEGAASFHTTRWTIVMGAAQSQALRGQSALARLCQLSREEIGRTVSDPAEIDEEIRALREALIASEGR